MPSKLCCNPEWVFSRSGSKRAWPACGHSSDWLVVRKVGVRIISCLVPACLASACLSAACSQFLPPCARFSICKTAQKYCYVYPLRGNQDLATRLSYCFLTASPFSPHPLPSLIRNCLSLLMGTPCCLPVKYRTIMHCLPLLLHQTKLVASLEKYVKNYIYSSTCHPKSWAFAVSYFSVINAGHKKGRNLKLYKYRKQYVLCS